VCVCVCVCVCVYPQVKVHAGIYGGINAVTIYMPYLSYNTPHKNCFFALQGDCGKLSIIFFDPVGLFWICGN